MKRLNITIPENIYRLLLTYIGKGNMSKYITDLVRTDLSEKDKELAQYYMLAEKEYKYSDELKDWENIDKGDWE
ncbi:MAG: hypothetical protein ACOCWO_00335 [Candidatus Muiribacteriaceae bacterium]